MEQDTFRAFREQFETMSAPEIASVIDDMEGFHYQLSHDDADGRIDHDVSKALIMTEAQIKIAVGIFAERTGTDPNNRQAVQTAFKEQLQEYDRLRGSERHQATV